MASTLRSNLALISLHSSKVKQISNTPRTLTPIRCGPRDNRGPLIKGRVLSTETIQAVQSLKRAHRGDPSKFADLLSKTLPRLIKSDPVAAFNELLRQDHCDLALKVFSAVRSEYWYKTDLGVYADLVSALARKGMTEDINRLICDLEGEGVIRCDDKGLVRLIKALIAAERTESTVRIYGMMKKSEWGATGVADEYVAKVLSRGLRRLGEEMLEDEIDVEFGKSFRGILEKVKGS
ncbi:protein THYLAKOID ASSEMBLY 8, chloroplastic [Actinidia eriantha]|uniref:protein THYLAKOID ASSEMBLY 8, chloroplastic n=1 Tax=Actinidia eriantha TaxID=165200 RepID=UPI00258C6A1A|nr:protein THYLAKOID ASSEMBLY 8, chloroplastic [Actinidia eriantha]